MNRIVEEYSPEYLELQAVNPFTGPAFRVHCNERPTGKKRKAGGGEMVCETYLAEKTPHTRVFTTYANSKRVFELTNKALWLFTYIQYNMKQGKSYVQINVEHYKRQLNVSSDNTFLEAKKELIAKGFIASTGIYKTVFWINPEIFFPGNRIPHFRDNLIVTPFVETKDKATV